MTPIDPDCYSVRRLSPFQGMFQVIEGQQARAFSADGITWQIQVRCAFPRPRGNGLAGTDMMAWPVRYGSWSAPQGLTRVPIPPTVNVAEANQIAQALITLLNRKVCEIPFPHRVAAEPWLLDRAHDLPLALLTSVTDLCAITHGYEAEWVALATADLGFKVAGLTLAGQRSAADLIHDHVMHTAGRPPRAQWFERHADGSGIGLSGVRPPEAFQGRRLPPTAFPELPLRETWAARGMRELVRAYHDWQAPWLLTLPALMPATRTRL